jgi:uncharacterized integral membrane protein (TIGR00697 family)
MTQLSGSKTFKYYDLIMAVFVTVLICSNLIGPAKVWDAGPFHLGAGVLFFPMSYLFGDILTEVYGYARSRRVVWAGFSGLIFASFMSWVVLSLPPAPGWQHQAAYETVFGTTPRIALASMIAYFAGEFSNSYVLAKMKVFTRGRWLAARTIGSTIAGEAVDSLIFYPLAFYGVLSNELLASVLVGNYTAKVLWEVLATPVTFRIVAYLKQVEREDFYDVDTDFTPFSLRT